MVTRTSSLKLTFYSECFRHLRAVIYSRSFCSPYANREWGRGEQLQKKSSRWCNFKRQNSRVFFFSLLNPLKNVSEIMRREVSTGGRSMRAVSPQSYSVISRLLQTFLLNSALARTNANWKRLFCTQTQFTLSLRLTLINLRISHMTPSGTT